MTNILIVGASKKINDRLEELLHNHHTNFNIKKVSNLAAAISTYLSEQPRVILMNNNLPGNDVLAFINHTTTNNYKTEFIILDNANEKKSLLKKMNGIHILDIYHDFDKLPKLVSKLISAKADTGI